MLTAMERIERELGALWALAGRKGNEPVRDRIRCAVREITKALRDEREGGER